MSALALLLDERIELRNATLNNLSYNYLFAEPEGAINGTIFLIHGWPDLSIGWRHQIDLFLSKGLRVVAPDMMGYGGTAAPEEVSDYTYKRASDDIKALADIVGVSNIILGGHDWGGATVYRAAMYYPDLVAAFFVFSTPYAPPRQIYSDQATSLPTLHYQLQFRTSAVAEYVGLGAAQNATRVRQVLNSIYGVTLANGTVPFSPSGDGFTFELLDGVTTDTPLMSSEELDLYVAEYMADPFNVTLNWYRTGELNHEDELALLPSDGAYTAKYAQPALYVGGSLDEALPPILSTGMETYFEDLSRGEVEGTHWMMWEYPTEINAIVEGWLTASVLGGLANLTIG